MLLPLLLDFLSWVDDKFRDWFDGADATDELEDVDVVAVADDDEDS